MKGSALPSVREEESRQKECVQKPKAGGAVGMFESGKEDQGGCSLARNRGVKREEAAEGRGQTPGPHAPG